MAVLFFSGLFAMMIKNLSEIPVYKRRYGFLVCMGITGRMKKRVISAEIQSIPSIAVLTSAVLSALYLQMHILREGEKGIVLEKRIWLYWAAITVSYLMAEYVVQKVFVRYIRRRIGQS